MKTDREKFSLKIFLGTFLFSSDNMEDDEAVRHLFLENRCEAYESSGHETPQLESFLDHDQEDHQIHGKRTILCKGRCFFRTWSLG